jgi:hypothetical protein
MANSLDLFYERVSRAIHRGKVHNPDIPSAAKDAVRTLEDINNWKHMWVLSASQTLTADTNVITLTDVKSVRFVRFHQFDSQGNFYKYKYMIKVSPDQVVSIDEGPLPVGFWMHDRNVVHLDSKPSEDTTYDVGYYQYSDMDSDLPWLEIAEALLIAQTMIEMSPLLKDDKNQERWVAQKQEKLAVLEESDMVHEFDGQEQQMIPYADAMDAWLETGPYGG